MRITLKSLGLLVTISCLAATPASADEIRQGAAMQVKPNSIWFQDAAKLTHWQQLKRSGDSTALASYEDEALSHRDAWRFTEPLTVKILSYDPAKSQVNVEMKTEGRMLGSAWLLDADAVAR
jgi:hypothetical protein